MDADEQFNETVPAWPDGWHPLTATQRGGGSMPDVVDWKSVPEHVVVSPEVITQSPYITRDKDKITMAFSNGTLVFADRGIIDFGREWLLELVEVQV